MESNRDIKVNPAAVAAILKDLSKLSGDILFEVSATWAHNGRNGETTDIVQAKDAIGALQRLWETEDPKQLRDVTIRWLVPVECVVGSKELSATFNTEDHDGN